MNTRIASCIGATILAAAAALGISPTPANANPGQYTRHGNVLVTLAAVGCAQVTWPKGTTRTLCDDIEQVTQYDITSGDRFGATIRGIGEDPWVSCSVTDLTTGDSIHDDFGTSAYCTRNAVR